MKKILLISVFFFVSSLSYTQDISIVNDNNGQPSYITLRLADTTYIHNIIDGKIPEHVVMGEKYMVSPNELFEHGDYSNRGNNRANLESIEPGVAPEADLPYKMKYSEDGTKLIVMYHHSNNLFFYDAETFETLAIVYVGEGPIDMEITEQHAYVCCYYSDEIYIINIDDYSIENNFPVEHQPCVIEVNSDESIIYGGFDNGEHMDNGGFIAAYGLDDFNQLFKTYWPWINEIYMSRGWVGRKMYTYSDFKLIGNENYIATLKNGGNTPIILNSLTGEVEKSFYIYYTSALATTASKDSLYIFAQKNDSLYFYCVDSYTLNVIDSIIIPNSHNIFFWKWFDSMVVNNDGSKLFMELGGITSGYYGYMIDFESHDYKVFNLGWEEAQFYNLQSYDGRYVVIPGDYIRVFDFETEDYTFDQSYSMIAFTYANAISPVSNDFVVCDNRSNYYWTTYKRDEYIDVFNFSDPTNVIKTNSVFCGQQPEADLVWSATINNHHGKIITGNPLSANISIIDANTYEVDTIIDVEHISTVKSINDNLVVLSGYDSPYLLLFDLSTMSIVKQFDLERYYIVIPSPDQQYVYAYNRSDDLLVKIYIDGSNSIVESTLEITDISSFYINCEYRYEPEISPDGNYILFNEDPYIKIVHTEDMKLICEVQVSGSHIFDMAFTDNSKRVCFAYWFLTELFDIIYLDGEDSYLENTVYTPDNEGGMSVEFNTVDSKFYIAKEYDIWVVDPVTAIVEDTIDLNVEDPQIQIAIDPQGNIIVNTVKYLYYDGKEYFMKEPTRRLIIDYESNLCIIPRPGPDNIFILDLLTTEIHEVPVSKSDPNVHIYPNPTNDKLTIKSGKLIDRIEVFTLGGEKLMDNRYNNAVVTLNMSVYSKGVYFVKIHQGDDSFSKKIVVSD